MKYIVPSKPESIPFIKEVCMGIMNAYGMENGDTGRFQLAVEEAAINSIRYAYGPGEDGIIEFEYKLESDKFSILIKDFGKGIDPSRLKIYDVFDVNSIASSKGRGFFLMQAMTDEFRIDSSPGNGTQVYLSKHVRRVRNAG